SWRSSLPARTWSQLLAQFGPKEMHRQEVIWELCSTERSFVQNLASILKVFGVPLRDYQGHWERGTPKLMAKIFDWLESILQLHIKISTSFDTARASHATPVILQIASAVLRHVEALVVHQPYLVRFEEANALLEQILHAPEPLPFASFVQDQLRLRECGSMSLGSFLLKPIQRLMKYPLFFKV
ncbi:Dbl homology domain-containing protein, partial [Ceraceosorus guamensis]